MASPKIKEHIEITTGQYVKVSIHPARAETRIAARLIDWVVVWGMFVVLFVELLDLNLFHADMNALLAVVMAGVFSTFQLWMEFFFKGRTLGKMLMRIRVVSSDGTPPTFLQCMLRWVLLIVDDGLFHAIPAIVLINRRHQRIGDMAADTYVVLDPRKRELRVNLQEDYRYAQPGYQPQLPQFEPTERQLELTRDCLYNRQSAIVPQELASRLMERHGLHSQLRGREFLLQFLNDYYYYTKINH
ncbi:MAG: RDD family protein [Paludibacteraceae bacterium]|nr:RDD family protein [Paludibacteraceae bacterium]